MLKQIKHNAEYWQSPMCKASTMLKYVKEKGVKNPEQVLQTLIKDGLVEVPKKNYVALTELGKVALENYRQ